MKTIKSQTDIDALRKDGIPEKVIVHIHQYFKHVLEVFADDYHPNESGWIILLEEGDPLTDLTFLEEQLQIRGDRTLVSIIKEFVDYDAPSNLFDVFVLYNDNFGMTFLIPKETWIGDDLLNQLTAWDQDTGNNCGQ